MVLLISGRLGQLAQRLVTPRTTSSPPQSDVPARETLVCGLSLLGVQVKTTGTVRQARLKPEGADHYPTLPVHMWTSADSLAHLVASSSALQAGEIKTRRTLLETDFEFRGGRRRWLAGWIARTRIGELTLN